jgi:anti-anti-sigma regulatory factor
MTTENSHRIRADHVRRPRPSAPAGLITNPTRDLGAPVITVNSRIERESSGETLTVVAITGEIDADTTAQVGLALANALNGPAPVCCDLGDVTFFGAAAAHTILAANSYAIAREQILFLRGVRGITAKILDVVDPDGLVPR